MRKNLIYVFPILAVLGAIGYFSSYYHVNILQTVFFKVIFSLLAVTALIMFMVNKKRANTFYQYNTSKLDTHPPNSEKTEKKPIINVNFDNIAGLDEIKEELYQIKDYITNPDKYKRMGANMPGGIIFYGPPGTGKTMLAKALANESGVTFIYASGSEFVEKYVGIGASRIRNLFEKARTQKPCIIFIDEIDSIGARRNSDNNSERDQTLNQLLIELDGFHTDRDVTFIAATNRIDILDEALLRPGRFDKHIHITIPSVSAREKILKEHLKNKPVRKNIDLTSVALKMHGMSGAHIASVVNEAALICVKNNSREISTQELDEAIIKVVAGLKNKSMILSENEKHRIAYHEAAHAIISHEKNYGKISRISILPHGKALGFVLNTADEERFLMTKSELMNKITILLGGRCVEELIYNDVSTGAENDLHEANKLAEAMVCSYGMSNFKNKTFERSVDTSCADLINEEISLILNICYENCNKLLNEHMPIVYAIADVLFKKEIIYADEFYELLDSFKKAQ